MRKLLIAGVAVASLTGIAYGQSNSQDEAELVKRLTEHSRLLRRGGPTCVDANGVTRKLEEVVTIDAFQFKCVETYGERLKSNGANWIQISPDTASIRFFN